VRASPLAASARLLQTTIAVTLLLCLGAHIAHAGCAVFVEPGRAVNTGYGEMAIQGFDPVAYFTDRKAVKGSLKFTHQWLGATWLFSTAEHRDTFAADPVGYAPQYGGFCANSMANGETAGINPHLWRSSMGGSTSSAARRSMWSRTSTGLPPT
jgi:hypothetical protein